MADGRTRKSGSQAARAVEVPAARRVLVAIDFSDLALHALPWAYAFAGPGGYVVLVNVVEPVTTPNPMYAHYEPGRTASEKEHSHELADQRKRLQALVPSAAFAKGVSSEVDVVENAHVAAGLRAGAERHAVDAIVLGSHCRRPVARTLLGSIAEELLRGARIPVFVVPAARD